MAKIKLSSFQEECGNRHANQTKQRQNKNKR